MGIRLISNISVIFIVCVLAMSQSGLSHSVLAIDSSVDPTNPFSIDTDIEKNVKILNVLGKDSSGNDFQVDLILTKDLMGMHQMMMQHMSMMGGMGHMSSMMNSGSNTGMGGMMNKMNNTMMQSCPCMQMMKLMQSQYVVEGGMITLGSSTYQIDSGSGRIVGDKVFLNIHAGSFKAGKIILYGKLDQNGGLKGLLSLPEVKTISKITGNGNLADAFQ